MDACRASEGAKRPTVPVDNWWGLWMAVGQLGGLAGCCSAWPAARSNWLTREPSRFRSHGCGCTSLWMGCTPRCSTASITVATWWAGRDLAFPERRLAVEYDGAWRGALLQVGPDRERLNRLHAAGWDVVFITAQHLREPRRLVCTVRVALEARQAS
jgi:hypothetical protein